MKQAIIVVPEKNAHMTSIAGCFEILSRANAYWQKTGNPPLMDIAIAGFPPHLPPDAGYFFIRPADIRSLPAPDLIIIPSLSYDYDDEIRNNKELISWVREQYHNGAEIASICTGAFLLAATGLLEGKACSTHWNSANDFRRIFPGIRLQVDKLITAERGIYTNGGAYSFLNMLLFLIEKYFDRPTAIFCAKIFQIDIERNSQSPFYIFQGQKNHGDELVRQAQHFIEENLGEKISFEELASKLAISRRNFDRRFVKATGNTPVEYLQRVKVEVAKKALEKGRMSVFEVMSEVGYSDDKAFREVFKKIAGLSPVDYKARYHREGAVA